MSDIDWLNVLGLLIGLALGKLGELRTKRILNGQSR